MPISKGHVLNWCRPLNTGIVDQDIELAEPIECLGEHGFDLIFAADVRGDRDGAPPGVFDLSDDGFSVNVIVLGREMVTITVAPPRNCLEVGRLPMQWPAPAKLAMPTGRRWQNAVNSLFINSCG